MKLKVGDTQTSTFAADVAPLLFDWEAPRKDKRVAPKAKRNKRGIVGGGAAVAQTGGSTSNDKVREGYVGKPKGQKQFLWRRGLLKDGMSR